MAVCSYEGSCHCGGIYFSFEAEELRAGMRCNCSICKRKGAILSKFLLEQEALNLRYAGNLLGVYKFGTGTASHYFCKKCGVFTHVSTRLNPGKIRVNLGCVEGLDVFGLQIEYYDGASL